MASGLGQDQEITPLANAMTTRRPVPPPPSRRLIGGLRAIGQWKAIQANPTPVPDPAPSTGTTPTSRREFGPILCGGSHKRRAGSGY
jgi:hypothetical protein